MFDLMTAHGGMSYMGLGTDKVEAKWREPRG